MTTLYKICPAALWREAERQGVFAGSADDARDGYIHFSTAAQVQETARRHFAGLDNLVLVALEATRLGGALKWEPSRRGELFPHLYGTFDPRDATAVVPLPLAADGSHRFPELAA